jgi:DNA polymerase III epsilon subunit-like protein
MTVVFFDLETGGLEDHHPDIQLAAIAVNEESWSELSSFEAKIQFDEAKADPEALKVNHYDAAEWARVALPPAQVVERFGRFLNQFKSLSMVSKRTGNPYMVAKLAGHNGDRFDGPRLQRLFKAHERFLPADPRVRCTAQRAMWYFDERGLLPPEDYKLATLCRYFQIDVAGAHDALTDVRLAAKLAQAMAPRGKQP